jgi:hypothetical protein
MKAENCGNIRLWNIRYLSALVDTIFNSSIRPVMPKSIFRSNWLHHRSAAALTFKTIER